MASKQPIKQLNNRPQGAIKQTTNRPQGPIKALRGGTNKSPLTLTRNSKSPSATKIRKAVKSSAAPMKSGGGFGSFIKN